MTRFSSGQYCLGNLLTVGAVKHKLGAGLAGYHVKTEVPHGYLAAFFAPDCAALGSPPGERNDVDLVLMFIVHRFPVDAVKLQEIISCCHTVAKYAPCSSYEQSVLGLRP